MVYRRENVTDFFSVKSFKEFEDVCRVAKNEDKIVLLYSEDRTHVNGLGFTDSGLVVYVWCNDLNSKDGDDRLRRVNYRDLTMKQIYKRFVHPKTENNTLLLPNI